MVKWKKINMFSQMNAAAAHKKEESGAAASRVI
jgi:hypothetical protein